MATACGGRVVSRDDYQDPDYLAGVVAHDWWMGEKGKAWESLEACRMAVAFPDVTRVNGQRLEIDGPGAAFVVRQVMADLEAAAYMLEHAEEYVAEWGDLAPEVALEEAHRSIARAWRALHAAARHTRSLRGLMEIARAVRLTVGLWGRITLRAVRPATTHEAQDRHERPAPLLSLSLAAHGPPARGGFSMSPQLAGGGPL